MSRTGPQSVGRIFSILECLSANTNGASLAELSMATDAPKTSLVGLLAGLVEEDALVRDERGQYGLGPRVLSLAMRVAMGGELVKRVRPVMEKLALQTGETVVFGALAPDTNMAHYLDRVESKSAIRYAVAIGERRELYCSSMGKVLLAYMSEDQLNEYLKSTSRMAYTPQTITDEELLRKEITQIQEEGIAYSSDERIMGASGIGAPIFGSHGELTAGLVIAGPTGRFLEDIDKHEPHLRTAAAECTRLAGGVSEILRIKNL